jgi:hypothetical protein
VVAWREINEMKGFCGKALGERNFADVKKKKPSNYKGFSF